MARRVFISYSSDDAKLVNALCAALESRGMDCWMAPRDIQPGTDWAEQIIDGIGRAEAMLVVFSSHSNTSPQVRRELERAVHRNVPLVPLRIEDVQPSKGVEYFLSTQHWLDAHTGAIETHFEAIVHALEAVAPRQDRAVSAAAAASAAADAMRPAPLPAATSPEWSPADLARIESLLAEYVGPVAAALVKRAATSAPGLKALVEGLAKEIDKGADRQTFATACRGIRRKPN